jgi:hypothetical protein
MEGRKAGADKPIDSMETLRRRVPSIVKRLNEDPSLALRAAANPVLALSSMGYTLTDRLAREVELRVRFRPEDIERLEALRAEVQALAGESFDLDNPAQLHDLLFVRLALPPLPPPTQPIVIAAAAMARQVPAITRHPLELSWTPPGGVRRPDPLAPLAEAHPVMRPLLAYRALNASQPPLASREACERLARGDATLPKIRLHARLKRGTAPE